MTDSAQLYDDNTARPYPLSESSAGIIPADILVDMSISVPFGIEPTITALSITNNMLFVALEDSVTKLSIGQVVAAYPAPFTVVRFDIAASDAHGWLVPGPGIRDSVVVFPRLSLGLDPGVVFSVEDDPTALRSTRINKNDFDVINLLRIAAGSPSISLSEEIRDIGGASRRCLVFGRVDSALLDYDLHGGGLVDKATATQGGLATIGGARPDDTGNVNIQTNNPLFTVSAIKKKDGVSIGLLFNQTERTCQVPDASDIVKHGRCEQGISSEDGLPLDSLVEIKHPEYMQPDCGCSE